MSTGGDGQQPGKSTIKAHHFTTLYITSQTTVFMYTLPQVHKATTPECYNSEQLQAFACLQRSDTVGWASKKRAFSL